MNVQITIVTTPIGNIGDITLNALEHLKTCNYILCEDTRKTDALLKHYGIFGKKLLIYNEHTTEKELNYFVSLATEHKVCVVSDAGTPLICDPGHTIIQKAKEKGIKVNIAPGVCALIAGATLCGVNIQNMLFLGFFNGKNKITKPQLQVVYSYFVAPHDVRELLEHLQSFANYNVCVNIAKDITKEYQQCFKFTINEALDYFNANQPKGEFVWFVSFAQRTIENIEETLTQILCTLPNWQSIGNKSLAQFLHKYCTQLQTSTVKDIYNALLRLGLK